MRALTRLGRAAAVLLACFAALTLVLLQACFVILALVLLPLADAFDDDRLDV